MEQTVSPKQVALAIGVSEASLKRWCDKGILPVTRTAGGHRRIPIHGVLSFLRQTGRELVNPEVLSLPSNTSGARSPIDRSRTLLAEALAASDESRVRRIVLNLFLANHTATSICDQVIAPAFEDIGDRWSHGSLEVYRERRGCEIMLRVLRELDSAIPQPESSAPLALGGTLEQDIYALPTTMVALALKEMRWRAECVGNNVPAKSLCRALHERQPRMLWLSVSFIHDLAAFVADAETIYTTAREVNAVFIVGGRALDAETRKQIQFTAHCDDLAQMQSFAASIVQS